MQPLIYAGARGKVGFTEKPISNHRASGLSYGAGFDRCFADIVMDDYRQDDWINWVKKTNGLHTQKPKRKRRRCIAIYAPSKILTALSIMVGLIIFNVATKKDATEASAESQPQTVQAAMDDGVVERSDILIDSISSYSRDQDNRIRSRRTNLYEAALRSGKTFDKQIKKYHRTASTD